MLFSLGAQKTDQSPYWVQTANYHGLVGNYTTILIKDQQQSTNDDQFQCFVASDRSKLVLDGTEVKF